MPFWIRLFCKNFIWQCHFLRLYSCINPLNAELNPICHLLALLDSHLIFHVSRIRVNPFISHSVWRQFHSLFQTEFCTCEIYCFLFQLPAKFLFLIIYTTTHCSLLRLIVRSGLDVPTFATRRLHACHHARAPSGGKWNCGRDMSGKFCLNADLHVTSRDLLHAVKLRHGADGFTSPPKEGLLRIFFSA
jgi:hypothetical protein